jgi:hypothetical protein
MKQDTRIPGICSRVCSGGGFCLRPVLT